MVYLDLNKESPLSAGSLSQESLAYTIHETKSNQNQNNCKTKIQHDTNIQEKQLHSSV
jgi:hypothetical protein